MGISFLFLLINFFDRNYRNAQISHRNDYAVIEQKCRLIKRTVTGAWSCHGRVINEIGELCSEKGLVFLSHLKMVVTSHPDAENCANHEKGGHCYCADNSAVIHNLFIFKLVILFVCKGTPIMESSQTMVMTYQASFTATESDCCYRKNRAAQCPAFDSQFLTGMS